MPGRGRLQRQAAGNQPQVAAPGDQIAARLPRRQGIGNHRARRARGKGAAHVGGDARPVRGRDGLRVHHPCAQAREELELPIG